MCGFAGIISLSGLQGTRADRQPILDDMLSSIAHRGPDAEAFSDDGFLALGFRRLSIVDVAGGDQPFWNEDKSVLAVVNGEIYNHKELRAGLGSSCRFRSLSDSEVILHLYQERGLDMLDEVNGIFALAIWDRPNRRLVLARDRLGVKPLYYTIVQDTLLFGSEIKALLAHPACPRELNWQQVMHGGPVHQPVSPSFITGVHHLQGGQMLVLEPDRPVRPFCYWSLNPHYSSPDEPPRHAPGYYVEKYGELFDDSVRLQLMSDVPLGIFLSGGIDSSLVAAVAARYGGKVNCFTIEEQTTAMTGDLEQARKVADELSFPLHPVLYNGPGMLDELQFNLEYLEYMVWCVDSPRFDLEWFFKHELYRYAKTRFPELKVMLTGAGADEFAGGYSKSYTSPDRSWQAYLDEHVRKRWDVFRRKEDEQSRVDGQEALIESNRSSRSFYQHMMHMNLSSLQFYNLWNEDRVSAVHGIEARVPFLDHRLVELMASVPPAYHESLFWNKQIVRDQLPGRLPGYPTDFPKVPFVFVPGNDSVRALRSSLVIRVFRDFCDKYVSAGDPLLPGKSLEGLFQTAKGGSPAAARAEQQLMWLMQIAIFRGICQGGGKNPPAIPVASPLQLG